MNLLEPSLLAAGERLLDADQDLLEAMIRKASNLPARSFEEVLEGKAIEAFKESPRLHEQAARAYLDKYRRDGRSEADLVQLGFELALLAVEHTQQGRTWPQTVEHLADSPELRQTILEAVAALSSREGRATETTPPVQAPEPAVAPPVTTA